MKLWHPMLFKGDMIRALLEDRKTVTRRIPTCANTLVDGARVSSKTWKWYDWDWENAHIDPGPSVGGYPSSFFKVPSKSQGTTHRMYPVWQVGNRIWVKETWQAWTCMSPEYGEWDLAEELGPDIQEHTNQIEYRATSKSTGPWRPSIFMPRWASRISLEVKELRAERVGEITNMDARAEGVNEISTNPRQGPDGTYYSAFADLWDSINKARGYGWETDHPVHVLRFERIKPCK